MFFSLGYFLFPNRLITWEALELFKMTNLCNMFKYCPNGIYALCENRDYIYNCKCRDYVISEVLRRKQAEEFERTGKPIVKYKSFEQYPV